ncbi:MAG: tetratricopeptide repeat protein [Candidatus Zixiibacteriota bacterium]
MRYEAEKKLYQADKQTQRLQAFGQNLSPEQIRQVYPAYREAVDFCYSALDSIDPLAFPHETNELKYLTYESSTRLARLLLSAQQYDSSIAILDRLIKNVELDERQLLPTYLNLGQTLQLSGRWDSALVVYNFTINGFFPPVGDDGTIMVEAFNLPLHLYRMTAMINDPAAVQKEFDRARLYYTDLLSQYPGTPLASASHIALADLYEAAGMYDSELQQLSAVLDPAETDYQSLRLRMAGIMAGRLKKYDSAISIYNDILNRLDPNDSTAAPDIKFRIALALLDQQKYEQAREIVFNIKKQYPRFYEATPVPQYTVARSLELQGNWRRAEQEYNLLIEKYPNSDEAMMAHLNAIDFLKKQKRQPEADLWYAKADKYLDDIALKNLGTAGEAKALFYRAELRRRAGKLAETAEILTSVFRKFPDSEPGRRAIMGAASIYRENLNNPQKADSLTEALKEHLARETDVAQKKDLFAD